MLQDIRFAIRLLIKNIGFTAVAIVTLALAVAANTVVFSIVNAILIRPLPFPEAERLVRINVTYPGQFEGYWNFSGPEYFDISRDVQSMESMGAWMEEDANLTGGDKPVVVNAAYTTASLLPTLGVPPMLGRFYDASEDIPGDSSVADFGVGGTRAVVLGYGIFMSAFGGDRNIIGRTVKVDAIPATVVGVMPRGFEFPERVQIWMPLGMDKSKLARGNHWFRVLGRLRRGVGLEAAQAELATLMPAWAASLPEGVHRLGTPKHPVVYRPLQDDVVSASRFPLLILQAAVIFVLLIACANISNLLLARAEARSSEIAVRVALGASRSRMARQFLTESMVLGLAGAILGILCAMWGLDAAVALLPDAVPRAGEIRLDATVLAYAVLVSVGTSLVFGLTPILHARGDLAGTLRAAGQRTSTSGHRKRLFRRVLILAQVALAMVLVTGAGLMVRSFVQLQKTDLGFDPRNLVTLQLQLPKKSYPTSDDVYAFWKRLHEGAQRLPGVKAATVMEGLPPNRHINSNSFDIVGRVSSREWEWNVDYWQVAENDYFATMGISLVRGRLFLPTDDERAPKVVLINEAMAAKFWPGQDPIGQRMKLELQYADAPEQPEQTIVGIVADSKQAGVGVKAGTEVYIPLRQTTTWVTRLPGVMHTPRTMHLVLRAEGDPRALFNSVRAFVGTLDSGLPIARLQTMDSTVYEAIAKPRFVATLLAFFAGVALLMAAIGIYGVMSYAVEQRTKELSIRMAMGADAGRLQRMLVLEGLRLAAVGMGIGLVVAGIMTVALDHWVADMFFDIGALDPATYVLVVVLTGCVAALASYVPARRATLIHPMEAMRHE
ncbi:ABC transporter permease [Pendulispora brunnea]|uniref:ABC transporter permease n=1 Tax=Pendulispora brunnea TaxID=2905690 RepID=A0ABZ2K4L2_9BACT